MKCVDLRRLIWTKKRSSLGTPGSLLKAYEELDGNRKYYKLSSIGLNNEIVGHEAINEVVVDRFLRLIGVEHLMYELIYALIKIDNKEINTYLCVSDDYRKKGESKLSFDLFYKRNHLDNEDVIAFAKRIGFVEYIYTMFIVDFLIMNRDRHGVNIEVLKDINNQYRLSPLFDHGLSLFFSCKSDEEITKFDILKDINVNNYFGTKSLYENLKSVPKKYRFRIKKLTLEDREFLFKDLDGVMTCLWMDSVFELLNKRIEIYENI